MRQINQRTLGLLLKEEYIRLLAGIVRDCFSIMYAGMGVLEAHIFDYGEEKRGGGGLIFLDFILFFPFLRL